MSVGIREMMSRDVWTALEQHPDSQLIDVRTSAEWTYVGVPDLTSLNREVLHLEWARFPDMARNPEFEDSLLDYLGQRDNLKAADLYFICRSGVRSRSAARAIAQRLGPDEVSRCVNVSDGFEGDKDGFGHRNTIGGWKAASLPWKQG